MNTLTSVRFLLLFSCSATDVLGGTILCTRRPDRDAGNLEPTRPVAVKSCAGSVLSFKYTDPTQESCPIIDHADYLFGSHPPT